MSTLVLALLLTQAPPETTPPPLAPPTTEPIAPTAPSATEPAEVKLFAQFVERHLLAVSATGAGFEIRQRERLFRIQDDDFETAFTLVPDALTAARVAHEDFVTASRLQVIGLSITGAALAAVVVATLVRSVVVPLLVVALAGSLVGLVLSLVALPFAISAQTKFFGAVAAYNRGLLDLRPAPSPLSGGITLALPE
jgi:hypothetical protein